jgi:hypothetical protein
MVKMYFSDVLEYQRFMGNYSTVVGYGFKYSKIQTFSSDNQTPVSRIHTEPCMVGRIDLPMTKPCLCQSRPPSVLLS